MQNQQELFVGPWESFLEALRDDVVSLGGSKAVGAWWIPDKSIEAQRNYVNDRLNADRRERFSDDQIELIMRRAIQKRGYSAAHWHRCDTVGTERPKPLNIEDEQQRAQRAFIQAAEDVKAAVKRLEQLGQSVNLRIA